MKVSTFLNVEWKPTRNLLRNRPFLYFQSSQGLVKNNNIWAPLLAKAPYFLPIIWLQTCFITNSNKTSVNQPSGMGWLNYSNREYFLALFN